MHHVQKHGIEVPLLSWSLFGVFRGRLVPDLGQVSCLSTGDPVALKDGLWSSYPEKDQSSEAFRLSRKTQILWGGTGEFYYPFHRPIPLDRNPALGLNWSESNSFHLVSVKSTA